MTIIEARTQMGSGSNFGPRKRTISSNTKLETRPVRRERQPEFSWTRDLDNEEDIGRQRRNEPTMLLAPWATHSGLAGTLYPCLEPNCLPRPKLTTMLTTAMETLETRT